MNILKYHFGPLAPKWVCATSSLWVSCTLCLSLPSSTLAADFYLPIGFAHFARTLADNTGVYYYHYVTVSRFSIFCRSCYCVMFGVHFSRNNGTFWRRISTAFSLSSSFCYPSSSLRLILLVFYSNVKEIPTFCWEFNLFCEWLHWASGVLPNVIPGFPP